MADMGGLPAADYGYPILLANYFQFTGGAFSTSLAVAFLGMVPSIRNSFNINTLRWAALSNSPNDNTTNYWRLDVFAVDGNNKVETRFSVDTRSSKVGLWNNMEINVNKILPPDSMYLYADIVKVGSPGTMFCMQPVIYVRPIG